MLINTLMSPFWFTGPVFAPADETGDAAPAAGEAQDTDTAAAGDGEGMAADAPTGLPSGEDTGADDSEGGTADVAKDNPDTDGDGDTDGDKGEDAGVPDEYTFELPDGMEVDTTMVEALSPAFKELGLTNDQASMLASKYAEQMAAQAEQMNTTLNEQYDAWVNEGKKDREIGHNNWQPSVDLANGVIRKFGNARLVEEAMVSSGVGNHPEMIRFLSRIGKALSDDTLMTGSQTDTGDPVPAENRWYGDTTPTTKKG